MQKSALLCGSVNCPEGSGSVKSWIDYQETQIQCFCLQLRQSCSNIIHVILRKTVAVFFRLTPGN